MLGLDLAATVFYFHDVFDWDLDSRNLIICYNFYRQIRNY